MVVFKCKECGKEGYECFHCGVDIEDRGWNQQF